MSDPTQPEVTSTSQAAADGSWVTSVVITTPVAAGMLHPDIPVVPADSPGAVPQPAGELAPDVPVVTPPADGMNVSGADLSSLQGTGAVVTPMPPAAPAPQPDAPKLAVGTVVKYASAETGTGRILTETGVIVEVVDGSYRVGWFTSISDPLGVDALTEVT
ncbi:MAG: hypothetical protein JWP02_1502 [Acidimicrobiales bacterium]|nr:hypothetical protein [Acidimicrobiales bacterium]